MLHLFYCIDIEKNKFCFTDMGAVLRTDNPNHAGFYIQGAWEQVWEVKNNPTMFEIKQFIP